VSAAGEMSLVHDRLLFNPGAARRRDYADSSE